MWGLLNEDGLCIISGSTIYRLFNGSTKGASEKLTPWQLNSGVLEIFPALT